MRLLRRYRPKLAEPEAAALAMLCDGSIGRALELAAAGGLALYGSIVELLSRVPGIDLARLHAFADQLARADAEDGYRAGAELLSRFLARMAVGAARHRLADRRSLPVRARRCNGSPLVPIRRAGRHCARS